MNEPSPVESFQLTWPRPLIIQTAYKSIMRQADKHPTAKQICIRVLKRSGMCVYVCVFTLKHVDICVGRRTCRVIRLCPQLNLLDFMPLGDGAQLAAIFSWRLLRNS